MVNKKFFYLNKTECLSMNRCVWAIGGGPNAGAKNI